MLRHSVLVSYFICFGSVQSSTPLHQKFKVSTPFQIPIDYFLFLVMSILTPLKWNFETRGAIGNIVTSGFSYFFSFSSTFYFTLPHNLQFSWVDLQIMLSIILELLYLLLFLVASLEVSCLVFITLLSGRIEHL